MPSFDVLVSTLVYWMTFVSPVAWTFCLHQGDVVIPFQGTTNLPVATSLLPPFFEKQQVWQMIHPVTTALNGMNFHPNISLYTEICD